MKHHRNFPVLAQASWSGAVRCNQWPSPPSTPHPSHCLGPTGGFTTPKPPKGNPPTLCSVYAQDDQSLKFRFHLSRGEKMRNLIKGLERSNCTCVESLPFHRPLLGHCEVPQTHIFYTSACSFILLKGLIAGCAPCAARRHELTQPQHSHSLCSQRTSPL